MNKRKEQKHKLYSFRFIARVSVLSIPLLALLTFLLMLGKITALTALGIFVGMVIITGVITANVFHELESFIGYLKQLAQGIDVDIPRFHKGIFGSFRLADAFLSVKNRWSNQTLSDARILENLPDPLLMSDETGKIVFANHIARDFFGDNVLKKTVFDDPVAGEAFKRVLTKKAANEWFEWTFKEGGDYTFQVRIERLPAAARNGAVVVIMMHDITPFKRFKEQQADFFANASHELKTPLTIVSGFIETLQGPAKDDEVARDKFLGLMAEQTNRMTHLVKDLLVLSRLQMTEKTHQNDVILMPDLLNGVVESLTVKAQKNHKKLQLNIVHDLPRLMGNKSELHQVFQNLLDNAIKYGDPHTTITIGTQLNNGFPKKSDRYFDDMRQVIAVQVHNIGPVIAARNIHRLFDRFYRVDSLKTKAVEGTGLGLGIAQQIVHKHDGIIDVQSTVDTGTTFTVYLPVDF